MLLLAALQLFGVRGHRRQELQLPLLGHSDPAATQAQHCSDALGELSQRRGVTVVELAVCIMALGFCPWRPERSRSENPASGWPGPRADTSRRMQCPARDCIPPASMSRKTSPSNRRPERSGKEADGRVWPHAVTAISPGVGQDTGAADTAGEFAKLGA